MAPFGGTIAMSDWRTETLPSVGRLEEAGRTFLPRVFGWMGVGLLVTALVAWYVGSRPDLVMSIFGRSQAVMWILLIAQIGLVVMISGLEIGRASCRERV